MLWRPICIASTRSLVEVAVKPFDQKTDTARSSTSSRSNSLGLTMDGTLSRSGRMCQELSAWVESDRRRVETRGNTQMTTISKNADLITLINVFAVDPSNQSRLVELLTTVTDRFVSHSRGFLSSNLHRNRVGTNVTMHSQWPSLDDDATMARGPRPLSHFHAH